MSHISSFRTPTMRAPKKRHKQEHEATVEELEAKLNTDNQGVGVIGEVTPGSRSTSGTPSVMRTNTTKRRELGLSSGPYTHFGQGSSNQAEGAQVDRVSVPKSWWTVLFHSCLLYTSELPTSDLV